MIRVPTFNVGISENLGRRGIEKDFRKVMKMFS